MAMLIFSCFNVPSPASFLVYFQLFKLLNRTKIVDYIVGEGKRADQVITTQVG